MDEENKIEMPSLYDMNKQIVQQMGPLSRYATDEAVKKVEEYFRNNKKTGETHYFMLLCRERNDYTLFRLTWKDKSKADRTAAAELLECITNRGTAYSINYDNEHKTAIEIWLKNNENGELNCYYLFNYDIGVIEVE